MRIKLVHITLFFVALGTLATARPSPVENKAALSSGHETFRNLVIDCLERSDATSCHKAGVYILVHRDDQKKGVEYIDNACELGKGSSCKYLGDMYFKHHNKKAQKYYEKGCLRNSKRACVLADKRRR